MRLGILIALPQTTAVFALMNYSGIFMHGDPIQ